MVKTGIADAAWLIVVILFLQSSDVAFGLQTEQKHNASIRELFEDKIKAASCGQPTDTDSIEAEIEAAVQRQIEIFVEQASLTADEEAIAIARRAGESQELVDSLTMMLSSELRCEPISDMESRFVRETLDNLDVRVTWSYTISTQAIPPEKTAVRIRLPKLHPCGGCKKTLESALDSTDGFEDATVDLQTQTAQFIAGEDDDVERILNELEQSGVHQLAEWKLVRK